MTDFDKQLIESSLSRVWQHTKSKRPFALLTAFRGEYDVKTNKARNKELAGLLRKSGYGFFYVDGFWIENQGTENEIKVSEDSIFVIGDPDKEEEFKKEIIALGKKYDQDGVLIKTSEGVKIYDKSGKVTFDVGSLKPGKVGDMYTKLRNNKKSNTFVFESERVDGGFIARIISEHRNK